MDEQQKCKAECPQNESQSSRSCPDTDVRCPSALRPGDQPFRSASHGCHACDSPWYHAHTAAVQAASPSGSCSAWPRRMRASCGPAAGPLIPPTLPQGLVTGLSECGPVLHVRPLLQVIEWCGTAVTWVLVLRTHVSCPYWGGLQRQALRGLSCCMLCRSITACAACNRLVALLESRAYLHRPGCQQFSAARAALT